MYEIIKELNEGVRGVEGRYIFDYENDEYEDLINLTGPDIYKDKIFNNVYWFGYRFNQSASRQDRSDFINYLKGLLDIKPSDKELERFINKPLDQAIPNVDWTRSWIDEEILRDYGYSDSEIKEVLALGHNDLYRHALLDY